MNSDVAVIGAGLVGLSCAVECSQRGLSVALIAGGTDGIATPAAAGMLAPSLEPPPGSAATFAREARAIYPGFIARVEAESDSVIPHSFEGLLELTTMEELVHPGDGGQSLSLLSPRDLSAMEPHLRLATQYWALLHRDGGWVDNARLAAALQVWVSRPGAVRQFKSNVTRLERDGSAVRVVRDIGEPVRASTVVLAAGAWTPQIRGLPRELPIEPVRGQMISVAGVTVNHVLIGRDAYAVPRPGEQALLGSTRSAQGLIQPQPKTGSVVSSQGRRELLVAWQLQGRRRGGPGCDQ